jgi:hypothetical protein
MKQVLSNQEAPGPTETVDSQWPNVGGGDKELLKGDGCGWTGSVSRGYALQPETRVLLQNRAYVYRGQGMKIPASHQLV